MLGKYSFQEIVSKAGCSLAFPLHSETGTHLYIYLFFTLFKYFFINPWVKKHEQVIEDMTIQTNVPALAMEEVSIHFLSSHLPNNIVVLHL